MAEEKKLTQQDIYTELIKATFKDNDNLLLTLRKVFYQMNLNGLDLSLLQTNFVGNKELNEVIRSLFLPEVSPDTNLGFQFDIARTVNIKNLPPDIAILHIKAIELMGKYIDQQLKGLEKGDYKLGKIEFLKLKDTTDKIDNDLFIEMFAYNSIIDHVEGKLVGIKGIANEVSKTAEQLEEERKKNSNQ